MLEETAENQELDPVSLKWDINCLKMEYKNQSNEAETVKAITIDAESGNITVFYLLLSLIETLWFENFGASEKLILKCQFSSCNLVAFISLYRYRNCQHL